MNKRLLNILCVLLITGNVMAQDSTWKTGAFDYDGFPLHLRFPSGLKYDELKVIYPQFITITHLFSKVKSNGLPEGDYNDTLIDFDDQLVGTLDATDSGITVLVETFGGKRTYYMYAKSDFSSSSLKRKLKNSYPEHELEIHSRIDKNWSFIKKYSSEWKF